MKLRHIISALCIAAAHTATAQPNYAPDIQREQLNRGLICLRDADSIAISWRLLQYEEDWTFNIYINNKKLNSKPLANATFFKTPYTGTTAEIKVVPLRQGKEQPAESATCTINA